MMAAMLADSMIANSGLFPASRGVPETGLRGHRLSGCEGILGHETRSKYTLLEFQYTKRDLIDPVVR